MEYEQIEGHGPTDTYGKSFIYGSKWGYQVSERLRQSLIALCAVRIPMGGSRHTSVPGTTAIEAYEYDDYEPVFIGFFRTTFVAEMSSTDTGTNIRAVLKDETANTTLFTSDWVNAALWTRKSHILPKTTELIAGHVYRAYFQKDNDNARAFGKAWIDRL